MQQQDSALEGRSLPAEAHVTVLCGSAAGAVHGAKANGLVLGRAGAAPSSDPRLGFDDPLISRRHARLHVEGGAWRLTDLGGRNRAFVDGHPLEKDGSVVLADGALLRLGDTLLVFRAGPPPPPNAVPELAEPGGPGFPGTSALAVAVRRTLERLAGADGHLLVLGETGTGKERVARALAGPEQPLVPQNCAELGRELARSELFGHLRGAYSGAIASRAGLVELADRGVLFLDEIGELALELQAELLRFLEDGAYRPVGATELRHSRARVVAATHVDLEAAVRAGKFRRDLLMRLRAVHQPLELPALRDRREDLLRWAVHFYNERAAEPATSFAVGTAECLLLYPWPGNLRELAGVMRELGHLGAAQTSEALPLALREHRRALREVAIGGPVEAPPTRAPATLPTAAQLESALAEAGGSVRAAAAALGIDRRQLYRLCERLGIDLDQYRSSSK